MCGTHNTQQTNEFTAIIYSPLVNEIYDCEFNYFDCYGKILYYASVSRHPYESYPPFAVAEFISSLHTKESIALFLSQVIQYHKKVQTLSHMPSP